MRYAEEMIELECPVCHKTIQLEGHPFGDDVTCPSCMSVLKTDYEESQDDGPTEPWVSGVIESADTWVPVVQYETDGGKYKQWEVRESDGHKSTGSLVATVFLMTSRGAEQAHLIAEAPGLRESVRVLLDWLDDGNRMLSDSCQADVDKARERLKRSFGEAP